MVQRIDTRCDLMLFGALGDLAQRKLFPALYQLERAGLLAEGSRVLAIARAEGDTDSVRRQLYDRLQQHVKPVEFDPEMAHRFLARVAYLRLDFNDPEGFYAPSVLIIFKLVLLISFQIVLRQSLLVRVFISAI